jgi:uncharacterized coiled-coil protein SlyX
MVCEQCKKEIEQKIKELEEEKRDQEHVIKCMEKELKETKDKVERHFINEQLKRERHDLLKIDYAIWILKQLL